MTTAAMRTIGIIGGMSSVSTALYYQRLNAQVRARLGGLHSAQIVLWSVDFAQIADLQKQDRWEEAGQFLAQIAQRLERAGASVIILATNTMHKVADHITRAIEIPFVHVADATAQAVRSAGFRRPGLIATAFTMEQDFYVGRLRRDHGLDVVVPGDADRRLAHGIIFDELCKDVITEDSRAAFVGIARRLVDQGADSLILGCTEVGMLLNDKNVSVPVFDSTFIHADAALKLALAPVHPNTLRASA